MKALIIFRSNPTPSWWKKKKKKTKSEEGNETHSCDSDPFSQFIFLEKKSFSTFIYCHLAVWHCNRDVLLDRSQQLNVSNRVSVAMNFPLALVNWLASEDWCSHQTFKAIQIQKPIVFLMTFQLQFALGSEGKLVCIASLWETFIQNNRE